VKQRADGEDQPEVVAGASLHTRMIWCAMTMRLSQMIRSETERS